MPAAAGSAASKCRSTPASPGSVPLAAESWRYSWQTGAARTVTILSRAVDDSGNIEMPGSGSHRDRRRRTATCPCSIWGRARAHRYRRRSGWQPRSELGTRFRTDIAGYITAIRFYRSGQDDGTAHRQPLDRSGTQLADGHRSAPKPRPAGRRRRSPPRWPYRANTTYVVSYHTNTGFYFGSDGYFARRRRQRTAPRAGRRARTDPTASSATVRRRISDRHLRQRELLGRRRLRHLDRAGHDASGGQPRDAAAPGRRASPLTTGDGDVQRGDDRRRR